MSSTDEESLLEQDHVATVCGPCITCIPTGSVGVVQTLGKYSGYVNPGIACFCCCYHTIQQVSLALQQVECSTECKTKDNVTLRIRTAVNYRINKNKIEAAVFEIENPLRVMEAQVDNIVRSSLPAMDLDDAYSNKDSLTNDILKTVKTSMAPYGYDIENVLIIDLSPERSVLDAMNQINAARRNRAAAAEEAEAKKILLVKAAEADAEAKHLSGQGVARMRKAMAEGVHESMQAMSQGGLSPQEAMHMMVTTQYLDTLKDFANNPANAAIMVPSGAGAAADLQSQVRSGFIEGQALSQAAPQQAKMGR